MSLCLYLLFAVGPLEFFPFFTGLPFLLFFIVSPLFLPAPGSNELVSVYEMLKRAQVLSRLRVFMTRASAFVHGSS